MNTSSVTSTPLPSQTGQAPFELKLNKPSSTLFSLANTFLISSKKPRTVAGIERFVAVTGLWSILITSFSYFCAKTREIKVLLPEPATPVTTVIIPTGKSTSICFRLFMQASLIGRVPFG